VIAVVKKNDIENKFKYAIKKLPGEITPDKCSTEVCYKYRPSEFMKFVSPVRHDWENLGGF
jgi:hypothetical protein